MDYRHEAEYKKKNPSISWLFFSFVVFALSMAIGVKAIPFSWAAQTTMEVYQQKNGAVFGVETSLNIFDDPKFDGQKIIAPFSEGAYDFAVYNNSNSSRLPYILDITAENPDNIPIAFSLEKNSEYIFGGTSLSDMQYLTDLHLPETLLDGKTTDLYTLRWKWKTESDEIDTLIGKSDTPLYTLTITANGTLEETTIGGTGSGGTPARADEPTEPVEQPKPITPVIPEKPMYPEVTEPKPSEPIEPIEESETDASGGYADVDGVSTGYTSYIDVLIVILVLSIILLLVSVLYKRGKNDDKNDPQDS